MSTPISLLLALLRHALGTPFPEDIDLLCALTQEEWNEVYELARQQNVMAIAYDGLSALTQKVPTSCLSSKRSNIDRWSDFVMEWGANLFYQELRYEAYRKAIDKLARFYAEHRLRMMLMKGYGLSLDWPVPAHRATGDIDIWLYGKGGEADKFLCQEVGIETKQNEDKHSTFNIGEFTVENHACFVNEAVYPSLRGLNEWLEAEAEKAIPYKIGTSEVLLPTPMFNAVFLPQHMANHFVSVGASLRQIVDWACFVLKHGAEVDWPTVTNVIRKAGYEPFFNCLNGIVQGYFGVPADLLPECPLDKALEQRVLDEFLLPKKPVTTLPGKVYRYFSSAWKYRLVYNDNIFASSIRLAKSYLRLHDDGAKSIWEKKFNNYNNYG